MDAPSTGNYSLGKGIVYFDRFDANGTSTGELDLGNAPVFSCTPATEVLAHYESRSGIKDKDKEVETSIGYTFKIVIDEYAKENILLALRGDTVGYDTQGDGMQTDEGMIARLGKWVKLTYRKWVDAGIVVTNQAGSHTYVEGTDYEVDVQVGRIKALIGGSISEGQTLLVDYTYQAASFPKISAGMRMVEGKLRFVGDPAVGPAHEVEVWDVKLKCESEIGFITDDWGQIEFSAEVIKDVANHPNEPWFKVVELDEDAFGGS